MNIRQALKLMTRSTPSQKWSTLAEAARVCERLLHKEDGHKRLSMKWDSVKKLSQGRNPSIVPARDGWVPEKSRRYR